MPQLHVNVDHIATIRQARMTTEPDPVYAALVAEQAGSTGITIHLREDRRHIQDRDLVLLMQMAQTKVNLEMAATKEMQEIALANKPDIVTLVPENRAEVTTEGGLDVVGNLGRIKEITTALKAAGIRVSLFIDPVKEQIAASKEVGADDIELHTGEYANAEHGKVEAELSRLIDGANWAHEAGLNVNAGHGLTYFNIAPIVALPHLKELNIGHSIISRSVLVGITQAVREMIALIEKHTPA
ncbi:MAG: pyridoxine 5'-phosphate synthase [SAR324 cluster bacterium]|nr:pyridoxine 5'-phosphate synthase [SAR324 cluster bacterium]